MSTVKNTADSTVDNTVEKAERLMETKRAIANAISYKGVPVEENTPFREYADKIRRIRYPDQVIMPLEVTKNGEYKVPLNADGYNPVKVHLPDPPLQEKAVTENGEVVPDTNYYGLSKVTVNVPDPPLQEKTVTKNGEVTVDKGYYGLSKVVVNCPRPSMTVINSLSQPKRGCSSYVNGNTVYLVSCDQFPSSVSGQAHVNLCYMTYNANNFTSMIEEKYYYPHTRAVLVNGSVWCIGRNEYDGRTDKAYVWKNGNLVQSIRQQLPSDHYYEYMTCEVVNSTIYILGGAGNTNICTNLIHKYDTSNYGTGADSVIEATAKLPVPMYGMASAVSGSFFDGKKIYLFGGTDGTTYYNTIHVFDPKTETLSTLSATLPNKIAHACATAVGTKIYIIGGYDGTTYHNEIYMFDTATHTLTEAPFMLPMPNAYSTCETIGTKIYTFGGVNGYGEHGLVCMQQT